MTTNSEFKIAKSPVVRVTYWISGSLFLVLGVLGIFLPLLPTTIFLILAGACYLRSSESLYHWLHQHPTLGNYLSAYYSGCGMPKRAKVITLLFLWVSLSFSAIIVPHLWLQGLLLAIGLGVTVYILRMPTLVDQNTRERVVENTLERDAPTE